MVVWRHPDMGTGHQGRRCLVTCPGCTTGRMRGQGGSGTTHRSRCPQQHGGGPQTPERELEDATASHSHTGAPTSAVASSEQRRAPCRQEDGLKCSRGAKCLGGASALTVPSSLGPENKPPDKEVWVPAVWPPQWRRGLPHSTQPGTRQVRGAQGNWPGGLWSQQ